MHHQPRPPILSTNFLTDPIRMSSRPHESYLNHQLTTALHAVMKFGSNPNVTIWSPNEKDTPNTYQIDSVVHYCVNVKGLERYGIHKADFYINVGLNDCVINDDDNGFLWDGKTHHIWLGDTPNILQFLDADGIVVNPNPKEQVFFESVKNIGIDKIGSDAINTVYAQLCESDRMIFLRDVLRAYNKEYATSIENGTVKGGVH